MRKTIYDKDVWKFILDKYPELRELVIDLGIQDKPEVAKELRNKHKGFMKLGELTEKERKLVNKLFSIEFVEQNFLDMVVAKGTSAHSVGADEDAIVAFDLVIDDFKSSFNDFIRLCESKNLDIEHISFQEAYEIFLEVIILKMEYKIPYTKLFIRQLLKMSNQQKQDSIEIKNYFLKHDVELLSKISSELLLTDSQNI